MFNGPQLWYEIVGITGAISALSIFLYSVYKIAKRIDAAIGVDELNIFFFFFEEPVEVNVV